MEFSESEAPASEFDVVMMEAGQVSDSEATTTASGVQEKDGMAVINLQQTTEKHHFYGPELEDHDPDITGSNSSVTLMTGTKMIIDGKEFTLEVDPVTNNLLASPVVMPTSAASVSSPANVKRPRGRPRKQNLMTRTDSSVRKMIDRSSSGKADSDVSTNIEGNSVNQIEAAILSNHGRRASVRPKKQSTMLADYETDESVKVNCGQKVDTDPERKTALPCDAKKKTPQSSPVSTASINGHSVNTMNKLQNLLVSMGLSVKRGRGRPRRMFRWATGGQTSVILQNLLSSSGLQLLDVPGLPLRINQELVSAGSTASPLTVPRQSTAMSQPVTPATTMSGLVASHSCSELHNNNHQNPVNASPILRNRSSTPGIYFE